jgi:DNA-binding NtrC family response regulator
MSSWSDGDSSGPRVRRLRKIRVLLLSHDRRFLRVAAFLLRRKGLAVETAARPRLALELVERHAPDVVVLDGNGSLAETARSVAGIEALCPSVAVVVLAEEENASMLASFRSLPKWSAAERLAAEVERAYLRLTPTHGHATD